jgi:hypothetical protein
MRTIRRLYIYLVTLISLELIVWGLINLLQTSFSTLPRFGTNLLASGLSLVLVGLPFFLLHGWLAQREARRDPEEQSSPVRALFHYAARLALLSPAVIELSNLLKDLFDALLRAAGAYSATTTLDRVISIALNLAAWAIMERLLRRDWAALPQGEALVGVRRFSRYVWMLYGLALAVAGAFQILQYLLAPRSFNYIQLSTLSSGLALILVGAPLWTAWWLAIQRTCDLPEERPSALRRVVLYALALIPALVVLFAAQSGLKELLRLAWAVVYSWDNVQQQIYQQLDLVIIFGVLWAYYVRQVRREWALEGDDLQRAGLVRLYTYPLAAAGNAATFAGAWKVLGVVVELLLGASAWGSGVLRADLAFGLSLLLVGLPFWLAHWPRMQAEALRADETGDHARRSVLRKAYLYLAVFLTVIGLMSAAGVLFYRLINAALGNPGTNLALECWQQVSLLALLAVWLAYHFVALRGDGRRAQSSLAQRQAAFGLLVLQSGDDAFYPALREALQRQAPHLPVTFHALAAGLPAPEASAAALVLPAAAAFNPEPGWQAWLANFQGRRVVVPLPAPGWAWAGQPARSARELALETALLVRQLAEGQAPRAAAPSNPWVIAAYVLGGLFGALLLLILFSLLMGGF